MHTESSILINAPMERVFSMTSDLSRWPAYLPHYRWVHWIEGGPDQGVVQMAALRGSIPIQWTSRFQRDWSVTDSPRLSFLHLSTFTKGMNVQWFYEQQDAGVLVRIEHDLHFRWPPLAPVVNPIIGEFMIGWVAPRTLATFKRLLEQGK
jgi:uncharacterized membrane protein